MPQIGYKVKFKGQCTKTVKNGFELYQKQNLRLFLLNFTKKYIDFLCEKIRILFWNRSVSKINPNVAKADKAMYQNKIGNLFMKKFNTDRKAVTYNDLIMGFNFF